MLRLLRRVYNWLDPPCLLHPGHRTHEYDVGLYLPTSRLPDEYMCSKCVDEALARGEQR